MSSLGKNFSALLPRSNSLSRLFPSNTKKNKSNNNIKQGNNWGHDSNVTETTCNSSFNNSVSSFCDEPDWAAQAFLKEVDAAIEENTRRRDHVEENIASFHELAWARFVSGSHMGAILSMRKAHRSVTLAAHIRYALSQMQEIKRRLKAEMVDPFLVAGHPSLDNVVQHRRAMIVVLVKLKKAGSAADSAVPDDERLIKDMYEFMNMGEI